MTTPDEHFDKYFNEEVGEQVRNAIHLLTQGKYTPAAALFELDPIDYAGRQNAWANNILEAALTEGLPSPVAKRNQSRFKDLCQLVSRRNSRVVPFVGAGLSIPSNMPSWPNFLKSLAEACRQQNAVNDELCRERFEQAANLVLKDLGVGGFHERYKSVFTLRSDPKGPIQHLIHIARGPVVTTNFDEVLEAVFGSELKPVLLGRDSEDFCRCVASGQRALLKLHGNIDVAASRVLTKNEYDKAYGSSRNVDFSLPIPKGLRALFCSVTLLFVGCSLGSDRIMSVFRRITKEEGQQYIPQHYAILPYREGNTGERFLNDRHIYPIWYPDGRYDVIDTLLTHLAREAA